MDTCVLQDRTKVTKVVDRVRVEQHRVLERRAGPLQPSTRSETEHSLANNNRPLNLEDREARGQGWRGDLQHWVATAVPRHNETPHRSTPAVGERWPQSPYVRQHSIATDKKR